MKQTTCSPQGEKLLKEWVERLGLQDWVIKLTDNCHPSNMSMKDVSGCTVWTESIKTATIEIIDPQFYGERIVPFDYEETLVHELLHLKTSLVSSNTLDLEERIMHQLIDDLARALVDAKRKGTPAKSSQLFESSLEISLESTNSYDFEVMECINSYNVEHNWLHSTRYFGCLNGTAYRRTVFTHRDRVVAFYLYTQGKLDPELHMEVGFMTNPRCTSMKKFICAEAGVYQDKNIIPFEIKERG